MKNLYKLMAVCCVLMCMATTCERYWFYVYNESDRVISVVVRDRPMRDTDEIRGTGYMNSISVAPYAKEVVTDGCWKGREDESMVFIYVYSQNWEENERHHSLLAEYRYSEAELKRMGRIVKYREEAGR